MSRILNAAERHRVVNAMLESITQEQAATKKYVDNVNVEMARIEKEHHKKFLDSLRPGKIKFIVGE